jgi:large subunit ribosomal protein L18Ae
MVKGDSSLAMKLKQFLVAGRKLPSETDPNPVIYRMRIFASDEIRAKSRFWYFAKRLNKVKSAHGEIVSVEEVHEKNTSHVKTYGITIRYETRNGITNMYREFRDTSLCGAVGRMYQDMAGRHRARAETIHIVSTQKLNKASEVKRSYPGQFYNSKIKFPLLHETVRAPNKALRSTFVSSRPLTRSH